MTIDRIEIVGGAPLIGTVSISGSKNSSLPLMACSLLTPETVTLHNIPMLADIVTMSHLLVDQGSKITVDGSVHSRSRGRTLIIENKDISCFAHYDIVRKMRASVFILGPLLARFSKAIVSLPGGCAIGLRPVNLHLSALEKMGASIEIKEGYIHATVPKGRLNGADIKFENISVGATENTLMAACLAKGRTTIRNAAREPEIVCLADCLNSMGAKITGAGTSTIIIEGIEHLNGTDFTVIPDRIEAGTYAAAALITKGNLLLENINIKDFNNITERLIQTGAEIEDEGNGIRISTSGNTIPLDIQTHPYPGFPTDMQAQFMALATLANGTSTIQETVFESRFTHVLELTRMGANITVQGNKAIVQGVKKLNAAPVMATDLRASASLIIAALAAEGKTIISRIYHIDRGYERIEEKLGKCGANIKRLTS